MHLEFKLLTQTYHLQMPGISIGIPMMFNGPQPNTYGVPLAYAQAFEGQGFVGDVRQGGSCNFEQVQFIPHCNGTHTECIGHITSARISIGECLKSHLFPAHLISISPSDGASTQESYDPNLQPEDRVITRAQLATLLEADYHPFLQTLVIRTLPNHREKLAQDYMKTAPPFFTHDAMVYLVSLGVQHLLVDFPSVDRLFDEGKLSNHHIFWNVPQGTHTPTSDSRSGATITEMVFIPDDCPDGNYALLLSPAPFVSDAAPSQPILFPLHPNKN